MSDMNKKNSILPDNAITEISGKENVIFHYRPDWMQGLELDIFIES